MVPLTAFASDIDIQTSTPVNNFYNSSELPAGFYKEPIGVENDFSYESIVTHLGSTASSPTLRTQVNAPINLQLQRKITTFLEAQYAKKITKMLAPSQDIATQPVEEGYVAVLS